MNDDAREALRERNRRRSRCSKCGSPSVDLVDGAKLDPSSHFEGITYRVCRACGREDALTHPAKRSG